MYTRTKHIHWFPYLFFWLVVCQIIFQNEDSWKHIASDSSPWTTSGWSWEPYPRIARWCHPVKRMLCQCSYLHRGEREDIYLYINIYIYIREKKKHNIYIYIFIYLFIYRQIFICILKMVNSDSKSLQNSILTSFLKGTACSDAMNPRPHNRFKAASYFTSDSIWACLGRGIAQTWEVLSKRFTLNRCRL